MMTPTPQSPTPDNIAGGTGKCSKCGHVLPNVAFHEILCGKPGYAPTPDRPSETPLVDVFDSETLLDDITKHPHREWRKAVAKARELERALHAAESKPKEAEEQLSVADSTIADTIKERNWNAEQLAGLRARLEAAEKAIGVSGFEQIVPLVEKLRSDGDEAVSHIASLERDLEGARRVNARLTQVDFRNAEIIDKLQGDKSALEVHNSALRQQLAEATEQREALALQLSVKDVGHLNGFVSEAWIEERNKLALETVRLRAQLTQLQASAKAEAEDAASFRKLRAMVRWPAVTEVYISPLIAFGAQSKWQIELCIDGGKTVAFSHESLNMAVDLADEYCANGYHLNAARATSRDGDKGGAR